MEAVPSQSEGELRSRTTYLWVELGVVILTCVVPPIFISVADVNGMLQRFGPESFVYYALSLTVRHAGQIAVVLFIIWRSNDSPNRFGLLPFKIGKDLFGGILLWVILRLAYHLLWRGIWLIFGPREYRALLHSGSGGLFSPPAGSPEFILLAVTCVISGFAQELVMRAYLIVRLEELLDSTSVAFFLSTVLFVGYHGYQGTAGVIDVTVFGLILAVVFCLFRRLAPISIAHTLYNFFVMGRLIPF
jgi:Type II CAAX prenyl endopeptidase Rce1-like